MTNNPPAPGRAMTPPAALEEGDGTLQRPYTVHLPGFDGPLDLLLHLIERNQLEITTISLVTVTDQFVAYLRTWDEPPLPRLAEFVAMAARLLLIKSRSLLPRQPRLEELDDEPDPLEDAEQLRRHLVEYKAAKDIARALRARELAGLQSFARPGRLLDPEAMLVWRPPQLIGLNVQALAQVFRRVMAERRFAEPEPVALPPMTIADKIAELEALLRAREPRTLEEVLRSADSRFAIIVTFLAVLELWHGARLIVEQEALFGPIIIRQGPRFGEHIVTTTVGGAAPAFARVEDEPDETPTEPPPQRSRRNSRPVSRADSQ
ncbi:MAG TPA: segregation/condensation protein A [Ktedonobacterales bacterium]|nr:segregation/condensation protein A [Ktedonobacterales bacterium]